MTVGMWRVPHASITAGGMGSIIIDGGVMKYANPWIFSEFGPGPRPLAMVGTAREISAFIDDNATKTVRNTIEELPDIFMSTSYFNPSNKRLRGLFPGLDAAKGVALGMTDIAGGGLGNVVTAGSTSTSASSAAAQSGGAFGQALSLFKVLFGGSTSEGPNPNHGMLIVKLHYLQDDHAEFVGSGTMELGNIDLAFTDQYLAL